MLRVKSRMSNIRQIRGAVSLAVAVSAMSLSAAHANAQSPTPAANGGGTTPVATTTKAKKRRVATAKTVTRLKPESNGSKVLQEVVVTANRRAQNIQDVGASITGESAAQIQALNVSRAEDLVKLAPSVSAIPNNGSAVSSYAIRGVGQADYTEEQEQPVAIYQDGVYIPNAAATGFPIYDVDHVEILRGPQGTLFGRNATGGLLEFFSNAPQPGLSAGLSYTDGDYNLHQGQGYFNVGNDAVSDRLAFYLSQRDGYVKNLDGPDLWAVHDVALRNQTKFRLGNETEGLLRIETWQTNGNQSYRQTPVVTPANSLYPVLLPYNTPNLYGYVNPSKSPFVVQSNLPGEIFKHPTTVALTLRRQVGEIELESTSSFQHAKIHYVENTSGMPDYPHWYSDGANATTLQQEFRAMKNKGRLRWTGGINFFVNRGTYFTFFADQSFCDPTSTTVCTAAGPSSTYLPLNAVTGKGAAIDAKYGIDDKSYSVYDQAEYDFTDRLTGIMGARYQYDTESFNYHFDCTETLAEACETIDGVPAGSGGMFNYPNEVDLSHNGSLWSGKAELQYHLTPEVMLYGLFSKGTKSGGYFAPGAGSVPIADMRFDPEELFDSEGGVKSTWLDGHLTADLDFYHYDYRSSQQFNVIAGNIVSIVSLPATFNGGEMEIHYLMGHGWRFNLSGSYEGLQVHDVLLCATCTAENELPIDAPKALASGGVEKAFELGDAVITIDYNARYEGDRFFQLNSDPLMRAGGYVIQDASLRATMSNGLWFQAWVNNLANKVYDTAIFSEAYANYIIYDIGPPRMAGVSVGMDL